MPKYSQNFLRNEGVARTIAEAAARYPGDITVEIGPGKGMLTKQLLDVFPEGVTGVEIDPLMVRHLQGRFGRDGKLKIIHSDFLEADLDAVLPQGKHVRFVGNLPYDCASPILQKALAYRGFSSAVFMFQKEVAERIAAKPGCADYGILTLSAQSRASVSKIITVRRGSFQPVPKVDSAVVGFARLADPLFGSAREEAAFFKTIKGAFAHRRKTVFNSLSFSFPERKPVLAGLLEKAGINPQARPETLDLQTYIRLAGLMGF